MFTNNSSERGQVGIGTLIVFIAMVLVAAIAAGVLINTAGMLQTQAEATGEESTDQVSDRLSVVSVSGDVETDEYDEIERLNFVLATAPGSDPVDLDETTVQFIGDGGEVSVPLYEEDEGGDAVDNGIEISNVQGMNDGENVLTDSSDRAEVSFGFDAGLDDFETDFEYGALEESHQLTVIFTTDAGASTEQEIRVPSTFIEGEDSVRL